MISTFEFADNTVGVMVDSSLDNELMEDLQAKIREKLRIHDEINLFFEIRKGNKMSFKAFLNQMKFNVDHAGQFNKVAVVTDLDWLQNSMVLKDFIMSADIKSFPNQDRIKALSWIAQ